MPKEPLEQSFFHEFLVLVLVNVAMFILGYRLYPDVFRFYDHPLSEIGAVRTSSGVPNSPAHVVFTLQMFFNSIFFFSLGGKIYTSDTRYRKSYRFLCRLTAVGMLILMYPYDINNPFHSVGTGIMAGSILLIHTLAIKESLSRQKDSMLSALRALEWSLVVTYAFATALDLSRKHAIQKVMVLALGLTTLAASATMQKVSLVQTDRIDMDDGSEAADSP